MEEATVQLDNAMEVAEVIRTVRQAREYVDEMVPEQILWQLLEIARWTGSSRNTQPWHFVVIDDPAILRSISELRKPINWVADAPVAVAIVLDGKHETSEAYDEGRVTERLLVGARVLGIGGGIAWFGDDDQVATGKQILGIPSDRTCRSVVALGYPSSVKDNRPNANTGGRKPMTELLSRNQMGNSWD